MALHPSAIISDKIIETLRAAAFKTEAAKQLPQETLDLIAAERWFQILVPKASGGLEGSLPQAVQLFEALTYADANVGWCVNLGAGANMFSGYLAADVSKNIFDNTRTCCAGSGAVSGKAIQTDGGYILSGRWKYASGANHATHFTANALLSDKEGVSLLEDGQPMFRSFIIPADKILNHKNWEAIGLKATSSNDFEAQGIFVPNEHIFDLKRPSSFASGTVYQFPFRLLAEVNMTCMITGIGLHFLEAYTKLAANKKPLHSNITLAENETANSIIQEAATPFMEARNNMYQQLEDIWQYYEKQEQPDDATVKRFRQAVQQAGATSRTLINAIFPLCGLNIVDPNTPLSKIWRDAAVAGQHYLLSPLYDFN